MADDRGGELAHVRGIGRRGRVELRGASGMSLDSSKLWFLKQGATFSSLAFFLSLQVLGLSGVDAMESEVPGGGYLQPAGVLILLPSLGGGSSGCRLCRMRGSGLRT